MHLPIYHTDWSIMCLMKFYLGFCETILWKTASQSVSRTRKSSERPDCSPAFESWTKGATTRSHTDITRNRQDSVSRPAAAYRHCSSHSRPERWESVEAYGEMGHGPSGREHCTRGRDRREVTRRNKECNRQRRRAPSRTSM